MKLKYNVAGLPAGLLATLLFLTAGSSIVLAADAKFEVQLIWATNDQESKDPKLRPVEPEVRSKLNELPLKWKNYFAVKREQFVVPNDGTNSVVMSEKCLVEIKRLDDQKIEVSLHGRKGDVCARRTQPLPKGEMLVVGGNAPNATAWLVTLKRMD